MQNLLSRLDGQRYLNECAESVRSALQDIAENLTFDGDLQIFHPHYETWKLSSEIQQRFYQLPEKSQQYYLFKHLRTYLYGVYYNGSLRPVLSKIDLEKSVEDSQLRNDRVVGVDIDLFQQLHANNYGDGYLDPGWQVVRIEEDGATAVSKNSLLIHVTPELHLSAPSSEYHSGEVVKIKMPKNRLQEGFYIAMSNNSGEDKPLLDNTTVRIYFNLLAQGSSYLMKEITTRLNNIEIPFSFKLPYSRSNYRRFDTGVLYIFRTDYSAVVTVIRSILPELKNYLSPEVPLFTKMLSPGIGLAEEPKLHFEEKESFGLNRCHVLAQSLYQAAQVSISSSEEKLEFMIKSFRDFNIDLQTPYLNPESSDIYTLIEI
jgi:HopA1 effector protein family